MRLHVGRVVRRLCEFGVVVTLLQIETEDGVVVAHELEFGLVEQRVEHHISLRGLTSPVLAIVEA